MNRPIGQKYMRCGIFDAFYTTKDHGIGMGNDRVYIMHGRRAGDTTFYEIRRPGRKIVVRAPDGRHHASMYRTRHHP